MASPRGLEPPARSLEGSCSSFELRGHEWRGAGESNPSRFIDSEAYETALPAPQSDGMYCSYPEWWNITLGTFSVGDKRLRDVYHPKRLNRNILCSQKNQLRPADLICSLISPFPRLLCNPSARRTELANPCEYYTKSKLHACGGE